LGDDVFSELETRIDSLVLKVQACRQENRKLEKEIEDKNEKIGELESENTRLQAEIKEIKDSFENRQKRLDAAAGKIQTLLAKLEAVE
jgi:uncharacterized coiled-coil DUF342 family protein